MSVTLVVVLNAFVAAAVVAGLAYVCRIPYRLDRLARPQNRRAGSGERERFAYERAAA